MKRTLEHIRDSILTGIAWAIVWAPLGVLVGLVVDPDNSMDEMWFMIGALPGFLCGALFRAAIAFAGYRLDALSPARAVAFGALSGVIIGVLPFALGDSETLMPAWMLAVIVIATLALGSMMSAVATVAIRRRMQRA